MKDEEIYKNLMAENFSQSQSNTSPDLNKEKQVIQTNNQLNNQDINKKKRPPAKFPIMGCLIGFVFIYIIAIVLGIFILWVNRENTEFLANFGFINDTQLKSFILVSIQWSFFPLTVLFLILTVIGVFILSSAKKDQPEKRKKGVSMVIINLIILFIIIPIWVAIYNFVSNLPVSQEKIKAEIIITPEDTSKLIAPVTVTFNLKNIETIFQRRNLQIKKRSWDFNGDAAFEVESNETSLTKEFNTSGTYNVTVKLQLSNNTEQTYSKVIIIQKGTFKAEPNEGPAPLEIFFDAGLLTEGQNIKEYRWDYDNNGEFDDETESSSVRHTFDKLGDYTVVLQTIDSNGIAKNFQRQIAVTKGEEKVFRPKITVLPSIEGDVPFKAQFDGSESEIGKGQNIEKFEWNFNDGSEAKEGEKVTHIFTKPGKYQIDLTITDEDGKKAKGNIMVTVKSGKTVPIAIIKTIPPFDTKDNILTGSIPFEVVFNAEDSKDLDNNITKYGWDFQSDGNIDSYGSSATYIFREAGIFKVILEITDADNQKSQTSISVQIGSKETEAVIYAEPEAGPAPLEVQFDATRSTTADGSKIVNYEWDFGDGVVIPTGAITSHTYEKIGNYKVRLKISSSTNETALFEKNIYVRIIPLKACFTSSRSSGKAPLTVVFDPTCADGTIKKWNWTFGDGFISDERQPTYVFKKPGKYTVTLKITDDKNTVNQYHEVIDVQ